MNVRAGGSVGEEAGARWESEVAMGEPGACGGKPCGERGESAGGAAESRGWSGILVKRALLDAD